MQSIRINNRLPQVYRVTRATPINCTATRKMAFFPRFIEHEFAPAGDLFRLMDGYALYANGGPSRSGRRDGNTCNSKSIASFTPRFDVKENEDSYELHGELPGVDQSNINVEFTDAQTLTIKGRTESSREKGVHPADLVENQQPEEAEQDKNSEWDSFSSSSYQKPSVEDEGQAEAAGDASQNEQTQQQEEAQVQKSASAPEEPQAKYWFSERSVGEFQRTFSFPARVDQDNVRASLKDGILSIVVPKAQAPASRRIYID